MATKPENENWVVFECPWNSRLLLPASIMSTVLQHIKAGSVENSEGVRSVKLSEYPVTFEVVPGDLVIAAMVADKLGK